MISFSKQIKNEILSGEIFAYCCSSAELSAYILLFGKKNNNFLEIHIENEELAKRICLLAAKVLKTNVSYLMLNNTCSIMINAGNKFDEKFGHLFDEIKKPDLISNMYKKSCCRASFLRGVFLSSGTITDPEKNYNLEFSFKFKDVSDIVKDVLKNSGFELKAIKRKTNEVLYIKKSDTICDILTFIGAHKAPLEILSLKTEREFWNEANRAANGETANYDKTLKASIKHITAIEKILKEKGSDFLSEELLETATLRMKYKDISIGELALKHNPPMTKSGINHRLNKILKIAEEL